MKKLLAVALVAASVFVASNASAHDFGRGEDRGYHQQRYSGEHDKGHKYRHKKHREVVYVYQQPRRYVEYYPERRHRRYDIVECV